jgi:hypothetical protein
MTDVLQLPETCSCCGNGSGASSTGSGDCNCPEWILEGVVNPEGLVTANRRTLYLWRDDSHFIWFFKGSGDGTPFGWVEYHQVAAP